MPTVAASVVIAAPPRVVAAILLDATLAPLWTAGLERIELVEGTVGEPGCVGHAHYVEGGRRSVLTDVLLRVVPQRQFVSRITGGGLAATVTTDLEPSGEAETLLTLHWRGHGTNPITWIMLPLMRNRIRARMVADLESLRRIAESR